MKAIIGICIISLGIVYAAVQSNGFQFIRGEVSSDATFTIWAIILFSYSIGGIGWFLYRREQNLAR